METIKLRDEFIKLGQALKAANLVQDGVEAKYVIQDGEVLVNGEVDTRRGRKLYDGDVLSYQGQEVKIIKQLEAVRVAYVYRINRAEELQKL